MIVMRWLVLSLVLVSVGCRKAGPPPAFRFTAIAIDDTSAPIKLELRLERDGDGTVADIQPRVDQQEAYSTASNFVPEQLRLGTKLDATPTDSADTLEYEGELRWVRRIIDNEATIILARGVFVALDHGKPIGESEQVAFVIQSRPNALNDYLAKSDARLRDLQIWLSLNATDKVQKSPGINQLIRTLQAKGYMRGD